MAGVGTDQIVVDKPVALDGQAGNDSLEAGSGNDALYGGDGNDILVGMRGSDSLFGENGNDVLYGFRYYDLAGLAGVGEVDTLVGGAGADLFVITYREIGGLNTAYDNSKDSLDNEDYALITDLNIGEGDLIQLFRPGQGLVLGIDYRLAPSPVGKPAGTGIYVVENGVDNLVAIVKDLTIGGGLLNKNAPPPAGITYDQNNPVPNFTLTS